MPESKKRSSKKKRHAAQTGGIKKPAPIDLKAPWRPSWYVLWGFLTVVGELIVIFLVKANRIPMKSLQTIVILVCVPIVAHLIVSAFRRFLIVTSSG
jgi:hypothetical protein